MSWRVLFGIVLAAVLMAAFKHLPAHFREKEEPAPSSGSLLNQHEHELSAPARRP